MSQTQFKIEFFRSSDNNSLSNSIIECLSKLNNHVLSSIDCQILKSTLYFQSDRDFSQDLLTIELTLEANLPNQTMPVSIVNQPPLGGGRACLEVWCIINCQLDFTLQYKRKNGYKYSLLEANGFSCLSVSVASHKQKLFEHNVKKSFEDLSLILKDEGYESSDIVRQWNYLNDIVVEETDNLGKIQNYQIFNECRASYYNGSDFIFGYPAATGIGMSNGGIVIDVIAQKGKNCCIVPLQNPKQQDAHHYSENVLKGISQRRNLSRPMFERGKFFVAIGLNLLFVSGTASIVGEDTMHIGNVKGQMIIV